MLKLIHLPLFALLSSLSTAQQSNQIKVSIANASGTSNCIINFQNGATPGYDIGQDTLQQFAGTAGQVELFTKTNSNELLQVNTLPESSINDTVVDIFALIPEGGGYQISIEEVYELAPNIALSVAIEEAGGTKYFPFNSDTTWNTNLAHQNDTSTTFSLIRLTFEHAITSSPNIVTLFSSNGSLNPNTNGALPQKYKSSFEGSSFFESGTNPHTFYYDSRGIQAFGPYSAKTRYSVYNITGKLLVQGAMCDHIELPNSAAGHVIVVIEDGNERFTYKVPRQ